MNDSRQNILANLKKAVSSYGEPIAPEKYLPVVPVDAGTPAALKDRFVREAEKLACVVHQVDGDMDALGVIMDLLLGQDRISAWDLDHIPLPGLAPALEKAGIVISAPGDDQVKIGLTGAQAALAATGSLVLESGAGQYRAPSILPLRHIAILREAQIFASMESWVHHQRQLGLEGFRRASNIVLVSGPSRTADIAMELVMGMHGPRELDILLVAN
jgi:L-lactate dehydrogenase complex protein LldG